MFQNRFTQIFTVATVLTLIALMIPEGAIARLPPRCGRNNSVESLGMGILAGFNGGDDRPTPNDEVCYQEGLNEGQNLKSQHTDDLDQCQSAFNDGKNQGFTGQILDIEDPSDCSNDGFQVGQALLVVDVRAGNTGAVGQACMDAYQAGRQDAKTGDSNDDYTDGLEDTCYQLGVSDGLPTN